MRPEEGEFAQATHVDRGPGGRDDRARRGSHCHRVTVDVDCVNVFPTLGGSAVWIDGPVTKVSPQPNWAGVTVGQRLQFEAFDGGQP